MLPLFSLNEQKWKNVKNEIKLPRGRLQFFIPCNLTYFYTLLPFIALFSSSLLHPAVSIPWLLSVYDTDTFQERKKNNFYDVASLILLVCFVATDEALNRLFIHIYRVWGGRQRRVWELRSAKVKNTLEYEHGNIINLLCVTRYREVVLL